MNVMDLLNGNLFPIPKQMDNVEGILFSLCDACNSRKYCDIKLANDAEMAKACCTPFEPVIISVLTKVKGGRKWLESFSVK